MKKYITTDKHPELKEGIILEYNEEFVKQWHTKHSQFSLAEVDAWKIEVWIKELQKPKWTDQDMIDFAHDFIMNHKSIDAEQQLRIYKSKS